MCNIILYHIILYMLRYPEICIIWINPKPEIRIQILDILQKSRFVVSPRSAVINYRVHDDTPLEIGQSTIYTYTKYTYIKYITTSYNIFRTVLCIYGRNRTMLHDRCCGMHADDTSCMYMLYWIEFNLLNV